MSLITKGIGIAKKLKHRYRDRLAARTVVYVSPVRRIERVRTNRRVVAMTFDDGPSQLPPNPAGAHDGPLTQLLVDTLERFGARGTFDVVGSTAENYPDTAGRINTAYWGGRLYDHYPDIHRDDLGGAAASPELIDRILAGGHEITNHTYAHILYGRKSLVYGRRKYLGDFDAVVSDLWRLHNLLRDNHGFEMVLARPPHYVDPIGGGLSSYDAYALMGYQYMAASFDGGGWLPLSSYEAEIGAMWKPLDALLGENPDALCGQIIFQKDGCNMARRTPVADGLELQLRILERYGYRVVTVSELMKISPFADLGEGDDGFEAAVRLLNANCCPAYRDNTVRPDEVMTAGELAMTVFGQPAAADRVADILSNSKPYFRDVPVRHPYGAAIARAVSHGCFPRIGSDRFVPDAPVTREMLSEFCTGLFGESPENPPSSGRRAEVLGALSGLVR